MYDNVRIYSITLKGVHVEYTLGSSSLALRIVHKAFPSNLMGNDKIFALIEAHARLSQ